MYKIRYECDPWIITHMFWLLSSAKNNIRPVFCRKVITVLIRVKLSLPAALKPDLNIMGHYCVRAISQSILVGLEAQWSHPMCAFNTTALAAGVSTAQVRKGASDFPAAVDVLEAVKEACVLWLTKIEAGLMFSAFWLPAEPWTRGLMRSIQEFSSKLLSLNNKMF